MKKILLRIILIVLFLSGGSGAHDIGGGYAPKMTVNKTTAPTVTDDRSKGFTVGSLWFDVTNGEEYVCGDPTLGAAVWWHYGEITQTESITGDWAFAPNGDGGLTSYDISVGDTDGSPTYGMMNIGDAAIGRTSYSVGNIDLDGALLYRNIGGPVSSQIEHIFTESTGNTCRFALPKSGAGNATYNPRSMLIAGPAPADTDFVTVGYWQTNNSIFDNLVCDTAGSGADVGIQNDLEVEGDIFVDSIKESTTGTGVSFNDFDISNVGDIALDSISGDANAIIIGDGADTVTLNPTTATSFSDKNITNVGDIALDTISSDARTTVTVTLGTDAGDDFVVGNNSALVVEGDNDRVGIGVAAPTVALDVAGDITLTKTASPGATGVRVDNPGALGNTFVDLRESGTSRVSLTYNNNSHIAKLQALEAGSVMQLLGDNGEGITVDENGDSSFDDNNITNVGEIDLDLIRADAANGSIIVELDNAAGADFIVGNNNALVVEGDNDRVGIGTNAPEVKLDIQGDTLIDNTSAEALLIRINSDGGDAFCVNTVNAAFPKVKIGTGVFPAALTGAQVLNVVDNGSWRAVLTNYTASNTGANDAQFLMARSRGTSSSPTVVSSTDRLGSLNFAGYDGNSFEFSARVLCEVDGAISDEVVPMKLTFETSQTESSGRGQRLVIKSNGLIGINEVTPDATLEIVTLSSSEEGLKVKGSASQTGALLNLVDSSDNIYLTSGDGLTGSEFVGNSQGVDIDFRWEGATEDKLFLVDAGNDQVRLGDGDTNYAMFASDGELSLVGAARVIINDDVEITVPAKGLASPPDDGEEDNFATLDFDDGDDEEIFFEYHLKHNYSPAGLFHVHVHFFTDAVPGGADETVEWSLEYKKVSEGEAFNFSAGTSSTTATQVLTSDDTVTEIYETQALTLTTTGFQPDNHILMRLHRNGGVGNDDYVGDARLFRIHIEYLSNKLGEAL